MCVLLNLFLVIFKPASYSEILYVQVSASPHIKKCKSTHIMSVFTFLRGTCPDHYGMPGYHAMLYDVEEEFSRHHFGTLWKFCDD